MLVLGLNLTTWLGLSLLFLSVTLIIGLFVSPRSPPPLGPLSAALHEYIGPAIGKIIRSCLPKAVSDSFTRCYAYAVHEANPILQVFYILLMAGGLLLFLAYGHPHLPAESHHRQIPFLFELLCLYSFYLASFRPPGSITSLTLPSYLSSFPYDGVLYRAGVVCHTCRTVKPARSKHCNMCNACVPRADHHCVWLNNCVGQFNYRHFIIFLALHVAFTAYGAWLTGSVLYGQLKAHHIWDLHYTTHDGRHFPATRLMLFQYITYYFGPLSALFLLCSLVALLLLAFLLYHLRHVFTNTTTNERSKMSALAAGYNINLSHDLYELSASMGGLQKELEAVQTELLAVRPDLAGQHPERSKELGAAETAPAEKNDDNVNDAGEGKDGANEAGAINEGDTNSSTVNPSNLTISPSSPPSASSSAVPPLSPRVIARSKALIVAQDELIAELQYLYAQQQYLNDCEDAIYNKQEKPQAPNPPATRRRAVTGNRTQGQGQGHGHGPAPQGQGQAQASKATAAPIPPSLPRRPHHIYHRGLWSNIMEVFAPSLAPTWPSEIQQWKNKQEKILQQNKQKEKAAAEQEQGNKNTSNSKNQSLKKRR